MWTSVSSALLGMACGLSLPRPPPTPAALARLESELQTVVAEWSLRTNSSLSFAVAVGGSGEKSLRLGTTHGAATPRPSIIAAAAGPDDFYRPGSTVNIRSMYPCGSVTKAYTSVSLLRLAEAGELELDHPVHETLDPWLKVGRRWWQEQLAQTEECCIAESAATHSASNPLRGIPQTRKILYFVFLPSFFSSPLSTNVSALSLSLSLSPLSLSLSLPASFFCPLYSTVQLQQHSKQSPPYYASFKSMFGGNPVADTITVRQLMQMRSGMQDYNDGVMFNRTIAAPNHDLLPMDFLRSMNKTLLYVTSWGAWLEGPCVAVCALH